VPQIRIQRADQHEAQKRQQEQALGRQQRLASPPHEGQQLGLAAFDFIDVDLSRVQTNFVMFRVRSDEAGWHEARARFVQALWDRGVLTFAHVGQMIRTVTHYGISSDDIDHALSVVPDAWRIARDAASHERALIGRG
jgi:threonine aldolase